MAWVSEASLSTVFIKRRLIGARNGVLQDGQDVGVLRKLLARRRIREQMPRGIPAGFINRRGDPRGEGAVVLSLLRAAESRFQIGGGP